MQGIEVMVLGCGEAHPGYHITSDPIFSSRLDCRCIELDPSELLHDVFTPYLTSINPSKA